jgi:integrase
MLSDQIISKLQPKSGARQWIKPDHENGDDPGKTCRGFGVKVMASGRKTFVVSYYFGGIEREYVIGDAKDIKCGAAQKKAREVRQKAKDGTDPLRERIAAREAPTVRDLAKRAVEEHFSRRRPSTRVDVYGDRVDDKGYPAGGQMAKWIIPTLGLVKVADIKPSHIEQLHATVTKAGSPIRANRVVATVSKMMSLAIKWEYRVENTNPCKGAVERNPETKRKRYLSPAELARLSEALAAHSNQQTADLIRLLTLTGARRGETMAAKWADIDLNTGIWTKPGSTTKQKTEHHLPLSAPALELLTRMKAAAEQKATKKGCELSPYLFPGRDRTGSISDIKKSWAAVCKAAGIENARLHDLRHSVASMLASSGASLPLIGALLGHSNPTSTARYAHLFTDPLREAVERLGVVVTGGKSAIVVGLPNKARTPR